MPVYVDLTSGINISSGLGFNNKVGDWITKDQTLLVWSSLLIITAKLSRKFYLYVAFKVIFACCLRENWLEQLSAMVKFL